MTNKSNVVVGDPIRPRVRLGTAAFIGLALITVIGSETLFPTPGEPVGNAAALMPPLAVRRAPSSAMINSEGGQHREGEGGGRDREMTYPPGRAAPMSWRGGQLLHPLDDSPLMGCPALFSNLDTVRRRVVPPPAAAVINASTTRHHHHYMDPSAAANVTNNNSRIPRCPTLPTFAPAFSNVTVARGHRRRPLLGSVVEVGCNVMCETRWLRLRRERHELFTVAVDPLPSSVESLRQQGAAYLDVLVQGLIGPNRSTVNLVDGGVFSTAAGVTAEANPGEPQHAPPVIASPTSLRVAMIPLQDIAVTLLPPGMRILLLMTDAQGFDLPVVESAGEDTLRNRVEHVIVECQHLPKIDIRWLSDDDTAPRISCRDIEIALHPLGFALDVCGFNLGPMEYNCHFVNRRLVPKDLNEDDASELSSGLTRQELHRLTMASRPPASWILKNLSHADTDPPLRHVYKRHYKKRCFAKIVQCNRRFVDCANAGYLESVRQGRPLKGAARRWANRTCVEIEKECNTICLNKPPAAKKAKR